ncbi:NAD(P)H-binding protein [Actinoplanes sp. NPDC048796]|uniref:NAD(P)-dependent oxidoreductase n=1 Tax=unclassified Actinoplanes TaxID=2626549 RepID=UPI0033E22F61
MRIAVLGATGAVGSLLVETGLARGLEVTALARDPARVPARPGLTAVAADVHDPASIARAVEGADVLVSGLGMPKGDLPGVLTAGAKAVVASGVGRIVWLGALGTGPSAAAAGALTRGLLALVMRAEIPDKVAADAAVLAAGGTLFHVGPLAGGTAEHHTFPLEDMPRRFFPARVSRAAVAAAMTDEAIRPRFPGRVIVTANG